mgnify:FL=1
MVLQPEECSLSRATSFNLHNVKLFFNNLESIYKHSPAFADGTRVYNLDETSSTTVQKPRKIIAEKGIKQVNMATSGEKGILVTTCCIVNDSFHRSWCFLETNLNHICCMEHHQVQRDLLILLAG